MLLGVGLNAMTHLLGRIAPIPQPLRLVIVCSLPAIGCLADRLGRRRLYIQGFAAFTAGSALCATASSLGWLIGLGVLVIALGAWKLMFPTEPPQRTANAQQQPKADPPAPPQPPASAPQPPAAPPNAQQPRPNSLGIQYVAPNQNAFVPAATIDVAIRLSKRCHRVSHDWLEQDIGRRLTADEQGALLRHRNEREALACIVQHAHGGLTGWYLRPEISAQVREWLCPAELGLQAAKAWEPELGDEVIWMAES